MFLSWIEIKWDSVRKILTIKHLTIPKLKWTKQLHLFAKVFQKKTDEDLKNHNTVSGDEENHKKNIENDVSEITRGDLNDGSYRF